MSEPVNSILVGVNAPAGSGHLSVTERNHPAEVPFLFEQQRKRLGPAVIISFVYHVAMIALTILAIRYSAQQATVAAVVMPPQTPLPNIIWLNEPGPGGGGGGGGNKMKEPPRKVELPGKDPVTVPVAPPAPVLEVPQEVKVEEAPPAPPAPQVTIPAIAQAGADTLAFGSLNAPPPGPPTPSQGSGSGGGAGTGTGTGIGPGTGSGLGPGSGGGTGGGVYRPGSGITLPRIRREVKPQYTSDAMRAKVQGTVLLECVVRPDGTVGDVHIIRSLDPTFGLDQEAVKAARQWLFVPGSRQGEPVAVLITIELTFTLR
jgi:TonB family protein